MPQSLLIERTYSNLVTGDRAFWKLGDWWFEVFTDGDWWWLLFWWLVTNTFQFFNSFFLLVINHFQFAVQCSFSVTGIKFVLKNSCWRLIGRCYALPSNFTCLFSICIITQWPFNTVYAHIKMAQNTFEAVCIWFKAFWTVDLLMTVTFGLSRWQVQQKSLYLILRV